MKGVVFNAFNTLVEELYGLEMWDTLISETKPQSAGAYTSVGTYEDSELINYVVLLAQKTNVPISDLIKTFGIHLQHTLLKSYPHFAENKNFKQFVYSINDVIHVEVRKLYPEVILPNFTYEEIDEKTFMMEYNSPRSLCKLAEGLLIGAAEHFNTDISVVHDSCKDTGAPSCRLRIRIKS